MVKNVPVRAIQSSSEAKERRTHIQAQCALNVAVIAFIITTYNSQVSLMAFFPVRCIPKLHCQLLKVLELSLQCTCDLCKQRLNMNLTSVT